MDKKKGKPEEEIGDLSEQMRQREELTRLLYVAAQAEHALTCRYLYAAFSFKRTHDEGGVTYHQLEQMRRWEGQLLMVARQEMEHLGLVFNLRTAIGEAPSFDLPSFPFQQRFQGLALEHSLDQLSERCLFEFALVEMPRDLPPESGNYAFLARLFRDYRQKEFRPEEVDLIARLYERIRELIATTDERVLFIGPPAAQFSTHDIFPGAIRGLDISKAPAYDIQLEKIHDRKTALAAIDQITTEGEGAHEQGGKGSHFAIFMQILENLVALREADPGFEPARPVVSNPTLAQGGTARSGATPITDDFAREALALFETSYQTMLLGLSRFFSFPQQDQVEMSALQQAFFFPMMTTVIRPLGEILTLLPSGKPGASGGRAGASFGQPDKVELSPHKWSAFHLLYFRYGEMERMAESLHERCFALPEDASNALIRDRLKYLYQQISRSRMNLKVNYLQKSDGI